MATGVAIGVGNAGEMQWLPSLQVDGYGDVGQFDKFTGGDSTATIPKYRPGGMGNEVTYTALPVYADVTLTRVYTIERDQAVVAALRALIGRVYGTVTLQPLDAEGNPLGTPRTYRGRIANVKEGNADSTSSQPRMWTIDFSIEDVSN